MKTKLILVLIAAIIAFVVFPGDCYAEEEWSFFDVKQEVGVLLSKDGKTLEVGEFGEHTEFCNDEAEFYCFYTPQLSLVVSIPKGAKQLKSWKYQGYTFCVIQILKDFNGTGLMTIVEGHKGESCGSDSLELFVYSQERGLIYLRGDPKLSGGLEIISTKDIGFGSLKK